jgi:thiamine pyrophosphate-dependent acetolactate synthase large subunit-like protein
LGSLCDGLEQIGVKQIFGLIGEEAESVGLPPFRKGIEFPNNPDFATLARACGGQGFAARKPDELKAAISEAFALDGPAIVASRLGHDRSLCHGEDQRNRPRCDQRVTSRSLLRV